MFKATRRTRAGREDLVVARANGRHFLIRDRRVVERRGPVRPALEDRQMTGYLRDLGDDLDSGRAGTDDRDLLAGQIRLIVRPVEGVERQPLEARHAGEFRTSRR